MRWIMLVSVCVCAVLAAGRVAVAGQTLEDRPLRCVASIPPLKGLVDELIRASGLPEERDGTTLLIPPGVSEHGYEIPPSKLAALNRADVVVIVGMGMEPQVEKRLKAGGGRGASVVRLSDVLGIKSEEHEHHHDHDHEHGEECNHTVDPHVWLDPVMVEKSVSAIAEAIRGRLGKDAEAAKRVWRAEESVLARVKAMDARYRQTLNTAQVRVLVVGHDAWGHLAKRYDLETVAIKGLHAGEPTARSLSEARKAVEMRGARAVCVEPQLSQDAGRRIAAETGVPVRVLDPLGDGDWFAMMENNLRELAGALGGEYAAPVAERVPTTSTSSSP